MSSRKMSVVAVFFFLCAVAVLAPGCKDKTAEHKATEQQTSHPATANTSITVSEILANYETLDFQGAVLKGSIAEYIDVENYTYLNLEDSGGRIWAAVPKIPVEEGKEIEISKIIVMKDFYSNTLERTFEVILFAVPFDGIRACPPSHAETPGKMTSQMPPGMTQGGMPRGPVPETGMGSGKTKVIAEDIKVSKAVGEDAYTIKEVYSQKKALENKAVRVRAKVVRFLPGIMGKNWVHVQDGTGTEEEMNFDIAVTTPEAVTVSVDDEVIVCGTLVLDKELGLGHTLDVLVEDASVEMANK